ncbi:hypothetical protein CJ030_MR1G016838 [Morella rubra]|uniref:Retrotransposon gag domain-containing protein n=1 Tax=Morella rubra TaxID=262757 RepID=A0A6A1WQ72_9ROSI|nr:hypothetical protein CJ030_MR1G016838 [Morella rubra]
MKKKEGESLRDYVARFNQEKLNVEDPEDKVVLTAIVAGLADGRFSFSLGKKPPETFGEFMEKAQKYMNAEDMMTARQQQVVDQSGISAKRRKEGTPTRHPVMEKEQKVDPRTGPRTDYPKLQFTPLNASPGKILMEIRNDPEIRGLQKCGPTQIDGMTENSVAFITITAMIQMNAYI